ncbi:ATP-binding protein [Herbaspirillum sp. LeCh32-8]|uniref:ATP-binding protein n=1 Tax=Herbaspirillum sp. LeCh32-8 TaxID=2821356 RepID=UPI001AE32925|nr:ATP-binding protein [Herbaspirillum sp. LeCh32-8]MBP0599834.1 ATP-binding protein [Herbaspirillum sp. LeCh32-8]
MENVLTASRTEEIVAISEAADVAAARRAATDLARQIAFPEEVSGRLALVVTEAATNVLKHAGHGQILLRTLKGEGADGSTARGIELLALDEGAGMADTGASMVDGNSTAGTYGVGLGAIRRQADTFDIFSLPGNGTVLRAVVWEVAGARERWECGLVCVPLAGEESCGDAGWAAVRDNEVVAMISDGLGHGDAAALASDEAVALMPALAFVLPPAELALRMHTVLQKTRGAAVAIARLDSSGGRAAFAGIGNIAACTIVGGERRHLVSLNGIVGHNIRKTQQFDAAWRDDMLLVLHSDGLTSRWSLDAYPGLEQTHPAIIAGVLYRDFYRGRDDVSVLVIRRGSSS